MDIFLAFPARPTSSNSRRIYLLEIIGHELHKDVLATRSNWPLYAVPVQPALYSIRVSAGFFSPASFTAWIAPNQLAAE